MVLLKCTPQKDDFLETEISPEYSSAERPYIWLVRPCERYKEMYDDCKSISARFQQYYIYGYNLDCSNHINHYDLCKKFRKQKDPSILDPIINNELLEIKRRTQTVHDNKAWELRDSPPADFNAPLPEFIAKRSSKFPFFESERQKRKTTGRRGYFPSDIPH